MSDETKSNMYASIDPSTGELVEEYEFHTDEDVENALQSSHAGYLSWRESSLDVRVKILRRVAQIYQEEKDSLARIIGMEMGKPFDEARFEIDIVSSIYEYYASNGPNLMRDERIDVTGGGAAVVRRAPVGSLLGIMPWNYPYYQVARFAAPNIMLGNTVLLKHAPSTPKTALSIAQIFQDAALPAGVYLNLFASNEQVENIIADPRNQGVSLTGSERAGSAVAATAGKYLKKCVLELGGSDPFIVLDVDDIGEVGRLGAVGRLENAGQSCISPKRFIVMEDLYDSFVEAVVGEFASVDPGDAKDESTVMGPMSSRGALDRLSEQVEDALAKGAKLHTGGGPVPGTGAFYEPTVLTSVTPDMRAFNEELFGPVAVVYRVSSVEEAVKLANGSPYGLGASVWSRDIELASFVADRLDVGMVWINGVTGAKAELPFGGVKRSGIGRELGNLGMDEFVNKKMIRWEPVA